MTAAANSQPNARADEPFRRVPVRLGDALATGEIDPDDFVILVALTLRSDLRAGTCRESVDSLASAVRWRHSDDALSKRLRKLKREGWIDFRVRKGRAAWYEFQLRAAGVVVRDRSEFPDSGPSFEHDVMRLLEPDEPGFFSGNDPSSPEADSEAEAEREEEGLLSQSCVVQAGTPSLVSTDDLPGIDPEWALGLLVHELADADGRTAATFRRFEGLPAGEYVYVLDRVKARREHGEPLRSESKFAYALLKRVYEQKAGSS